MATPAEKKALIFVAVVALLGSGVRLWRLQHPASSTSHRTHSDSDPESDTESDADPSDARHTSKRISSKHSRSRGKNVRSKRQLPRDSTSVIDLDRASLHALESLDVLKPGVARLIIADRDTFGPFGSFHELERVPYLTKADLRSLAPRVTFSLLPRPKNAVMSPHPDPAPPRKTHHPKPVTSQGPAR